MAHEDVSSAVQLRVAFRSESSPLSLLPLASLPHCLLRSSFVFCIFPDGSYSMPARVPFFASAWNRFLALGATWGCDINRRCVRAKS